ncbi:MAG: hypothetical protein ACYC6N_29345 [Pirellulaceae bacterium]
MWRLPEVHTDPLKGIGVTVLYGATSAFDGGNLRNWDAAGHHVTTYGRAIEVLADERKCCQKWNFFLRPEVAGRDENDLVFGNLRYGPLIAKERTRLGLRRTSRFMNVLLFRKNSSRRGYSNLSAFRLL